MHNALRLTALLVVLMPLTGVALAGSTTPPSVGGAIAELGCSPEPTMGSALNGAACVAMAKTVFRYDTNAAAVQAALAQMELAQADAELQLDDLQGALTAEEQVRLQMSMDRLSKLMSTLSNLLKSISETQTAIVQNMK